MEGSYLVRSNMARNTNINGLASLLNAYSQKMQTEVKEIVEYHTGEIETAAIRDAPGPGDPIKTQHGNIRQDQIADKRRGNFVAISQAIGYTIDTSGYKGTVYVERSAGEIAAYCEFGTGQSAASYLSNTPAEWRSLAQRFYVDGQGTIINQPYLLPNFLRQKPKFIQDLKDLAKNTKI